MRPIHYEHVCGEAARGINEVALSTGVPCAFGVLTVDSMEQALARAGGGKRHQGEDAARAVLRMAELRVGAGTQLLHTAPRLTRLRERLKKGAQPTRAHRR